MRGVGSVVTLLSLSAVTAGVLMVSANASFEPPYVPADPSGWTALDGEKTDPYQAIGRLAEEWYGAPLGVQRALAYQLASESRGEARASLGVKSGAPPWVKSNASPDEARAAERGYERIAAPRRKVWESAGWSRAAWSFGSGGLFGLLPSTALATLVRREVGRSWIEANKAGPWDVFDPRRGTALYLDFMRRVLKLGGVNSWVDIKYASASIATLRNPVSARRERILANIPVMTARAGIPSSFPTSAIDAESRAFLLSFDVEKGYAL